MELVEGKRREQGVYMCACVYICACVHLCMCDSVLVWCLRTCVHIRTPKFIVSFNPIAWFKMVNYITPSIGMLDNRFSS